jgi:hypothetical protein
MNSTDMMGSHCSKLRDLEWRMERYEQGADRAAD